VLWQRHIVMSGDSLIKLAKKFNTSVQVIKQANKLQSNIIKINQELIIPIAATAPIPQNKMLQKLSKILKHSSGPKHSVYIVKPKDTLSQIARRYKLKTAEIRFWNQLKNNSKLIPGQKLTLWLKK